MSIVNDALLCRNEAALRPRIGTHHPAQGRRCCDDHFFRKAAALSIPIELTDMRLVTLMSQGPGLPQVYAALTSLTGPSGALYDDWKGAFAFAFKLTVCRDDREYRYLLNLMNFRSMVDPNIYPVQHPGESYPRYLYHAPFNDELTADDILELVGFVYGFIGGYLIGMPKWTTPFVKEIHSNLILFGYDPVSDSFFEQQYKKEEEYQTALAHWHTIIPKKTLSTQIEELDW